MNSFSGAGLHCLRQQSLLQPLGTGLPIYICSDSQGALKALLGCKFYSFLVLECRTTIQQIPTLVWVPEHDGMPRNEIADSLARDSSTTSFYGPETRVIVSSSKKAKLFLALSRRNVGCFVGVLTTHCTLKEHLHTMRILNFLLCEKRASKIKNNFVGMHNWSSGGLGASLKVKFKKGLRANVDVF